MDRAGIVGPELGLRLEVGAARAVPALVHPLVDVPVVIDALDDLLHPLHVPLVRGADEEVVGGVDLGRHLLEAGREAVAQLSRSDALGLRLLRDGLPVLVGSGQEEDLIAALAVVSGQDVGGDRRVGVPQMGLAVDVVDRRGDIEAHGRLSIAYGARAQTKAAGGFTAGRREPKPAVRRGLRLALLAVPQDVSARAADALVDARASVEEVPALAALELVVALAALELVLPLTALQLVLAAAALQLVLAAEADQRVLAAGTNLLVRTGSTLDDVPPAGADEAAAAVTAADEIVARAGIHLVEAGEGDDRVGTGRAGESVIAERADNAGPHAAAVVDRLPVGLGVRARARIRRQVDRARAVRVGEPDVLGRTAGARGDRDSGAVGRPARMHIVVSTQRARDDAAGASSGGCDRSVAARRAATDERELLAIWRVVRGEIVLAPRGVRLGQLALAAAVGVHRPDRAVRVAPGERDLHAVRRVVRLGVPVSGVVRRQVDATAPVRVHYEGVASAHALVGVGDLLAVRRPCRQLLRAGNPGRQVDWARPVGVHHPDVPVAAAVAGEHDPLAVRREGRVVVRRRVGARRQVRLSRPVLVHDPDVRAMGEDDLAVRSGRERCIRLARHQQRAGECRGPDQRRAEEGPPGAGSRSTHGGLPPVLVCPRADCPACLALVHGELPVKPVEPPLPGDHGV